MRPTDTKEQREKEAARTREWRIANAEKMKAKKAEWYQAHKNDTIFRAKRAATMRELRKNHPLSPEQRARATERHKAWILKNRDKVKIQKAQYYLEHIDEHQAKCRQYYTQNKDAVSEMFKEYARTHADEIAHYKEEWRQSPEGKMSIAKHIARRRRELGFEPLNRVFEGSAGHHIDSNRVIYIPEEMHKTYPHDIHRPETMKVINALALEFLKSQQNGGEL